MVIFIDEDMETWRFYSHITSYYREGQSPGLLRLGSVAFLPTSFVLTHFNLDRMKVNVRPREKMDCEGRWAEEREPEWLPALTWVPLLLSLGASVFSEREHSLRRD